MIRVYYVEYTIYFSRRNLHEEFLRFFDFLNVQKSLLHICLVLLNYE